MQEWEARARPLKCGMVIFSPQCFTQELEAGHKHMFEKSRIEWLLGRRRSSEDLHKWQWRSVCLGANSAHALLLLSVRSRRRSVRCAAKGHLAIFLSDHRPTDRRALEIWIKDVAVAGPITLFTLYSWWFSGCIHTRSMTGFFWGAGSLGRLIFWLKSKNQNILRSLVAMHLENHQLNIVNKVSGPATTTALMRRQLSHLRFVTFDLDVPPACEILFGQLQL